MSLMIRQLVQSQFTVVAVLHNPNMAYQFGDAFIYVHNKTAHQGAEGRPREHPVVREIFHDDLQVIEDQGKYVFRPHL